MLQSVFRAAPVGIGLVRDRILEFVNDQICTMLGYSRTELVGRSARLLYPTQEEFEVVGEEKYRQIHAQGTGTVETRWRCRDGRIIHVLLSSTPLVPDDWSRGVTFTALDITERKRVERERSRLAAIVEATTDFVGFTDVEGRILYINSAGWTMLGRDPEHQLVRHVTECHPDWAARLVSATGLPAAGRHGTWIGETALLSADGQEIPTSQVIIAHRSPGGDIEFYSTIIRDLRELRKAREEAERIGEQYRQAQKMEAIGRLAGGVAHDFNNILLAIQGYVDLLLRRIQPGPERRHVERIGEATSRAAGLTRQLLAFGRKQMLQPKVVNLNDVVGETRTLLTRLIGEDVEVVTKLEPGLGAVRVDPAQIGQALMNLAVNARDAMPEGGRITIETAQVDEATQAPRGGGAIPPPWVSLSVSDTGVGMSPSVIERLFEPFFTTKERGKGTGLGLSMVYGTVQQSGGEISVSSEPGQGATFTLTFPRVSEAAEPLAAPRERAQAPGGQETILLVEDAPEVCDVVREGLEKLGYHVIAAPGGEAALELVEGHLGPIHLLLTDVVLPGISGAGLARRLRPRFPGLAILLMSGYTEDASVREAVRDGMSFLQKPFSMEELAREVRRRLAGARRS